jgi:glutathione synthase/RimK-type ligase-like ATP-grasp enzyme
MKAYLFRPHDMGKKSCEGIAKLSKTGIFVVQNGEQEHPKDPHLCIRWGCTARAPDRRIILNRRGSMEVTGDKGAFRRTLMKAGLTMKCWGMTKNGELWGDGWNGRTPCVVRPDFHEKGKDFFLCKTWAEYHAAQNKCGPNWYAAIYVEKTAEYRVNVLQGRVLCIIAKSPKNKDDKVWAQGHTRILRWSEWPVTACYQAIKAVAVGELDFAGVDVIEDKVGNFYVLEVNTLPYLEGTYQQEVFAKGFDYVAEKGKEGIPMDFTKGESWKTYIHPAISEMAVV